MDEKNDSLGYFCICMEEFPHDFQPLDSWDIFKNESAVEIKDIFLYLANLQSDKERLVALVNVIENWECVAESGEYSISSLKVSLSSGVDRRFVGLFASYIYAGRKEDKEDIFLVIESACMLAGKYAECLCDPTGLRPSGMENRDIVTAIIGGTADVGIAVKARYHPIMGYCGESFTYIDSLVFEDLLSIVNMAAFSILKTGASIHKCKNCGNYFIPGSRSDEIYCDKPLPNGKTCKTVGYDERIKHDDVLREYRKIYKTQNARKQRNSHKKNIAEKFQKWVIFAKKEVSKCQSGEISLDEMISAISADDWMR